MIETALYGRIRPKLSAWGEIDRVENTISSGMPDVFYTIGVSGWIETKMERQGVLHFERFQLGWARRHLREGATNLFVMTAVEGSRSGAMNLYHYSELTKAPFTLKKEWFVIRAEDLEPVLKMSKPYDWDALRLVLSRPFTPP